MLKKCDLLCSFFSFTFFFNLSHIETKGDRCREQTNSARAIAAVFEDIVASFNKKEKYSTWIELKINKLLFSAFNGNFNEIDFPIYWYNFLYGSGKFTPFHDHAMSSLWCSNKAILKNITTCMYLLVLVFSHRKKSDYFAVFRSNPMWQ